jgi:tRNA-dihydrouridine synthase B
VTNSYHERPVTSSAAPTAASTAAASVEPGGGALTEPWVLGGVRIPNRVVLAPLAGIGNWFVRLQARRHGAGLVTSEMVSSFAIHHRNQRTLTELLRIHPDERVGGAVSIQLFGHDPDVMESAAERVAAAGADLIDLNMGCPVPKVCKTGAGAALLQDPAKAVAIARAAGRGSGLPVTVKLRSGERPGDLSGIEVSRRLAEAGVVAAICLHPRHASQRHSGRPDYELAAELAAELPVPLIISGGIRSAQRARDAFHQTGAAAVALARGSLGNPWLFAQLLGRRTEEPTRDEILAELDWVMDRAVEHLGPERATRYLRKFYPWYLERLEATRPLQDALQRADSLAAARELLQITPGLGAGQVPVNPPPGSPRPAPLLAA